MEISYDANNDPIYPMKVVLLGQSSVGKSSLVLRFVQDRFIPNTEGTIGAAFLVKSLPLTGETVKFEIWDTAGQERYHSLAPMYYRGAQAAIIVFDLSSRDSFDKAQIWVDELREKSSPDQIVAFVANKLDIQDKRQVSKEEGENYASQHDLLYLETSAKDGTNVNELFKLLADKLPKNDQARLYSNRLNLSEKKSRTCCG